MQRLHMIIASAAVRQLAALLIASVGLWLFAVHAQAIESQPEAAFRSSSDTTADSICLLIESAAVANGLPIPFLTRLIGQESSFRTHVEGPITRNGDRAQGIAQFMPGTARARGLLDPFDPVQALPRAAEYLSELRDRFGNLGLAAAGYNAGPTRVQSWLDGRGGLPEETRDYVVRITGRVAEDWSTLARGEMPAGAMFPGTVAAPGDGTCATVRAMLGSGRNPYLAALDQRVRAGVAQPWGVQLAGGFNRSRVLTSYAAAERRFAAVLAGHDPILLRQRLLSRGTRAFYQARVGEGSRAAAEALCNRLRAAGGACLVLRNTPAGRRRA